jgi:hypothetical protein
MYREGSKRPKYLSLLDISYLVYSSRGYSGTTEVTWLVLKNRD